MTTRVASLDTDSEDVIDYLDPLSDSVLESPPKKIRLIKQPKNFTIEEKELIFGKFYLL